MRKELFWFEILTIVFQRGGGVPELFVADCTKTQNKVTPGI